MGLACNPARNPDLILEAPQPLGSSAQRICSDYSGDGFGPISLRAFFKPHPWSSDLGSTIRGATLRAPLQIVIPDFGRLQVLVVLSDFYLSRSSN